MKRAPNAQRRTRNIKRMGRLAVMETPANHYGKQTPNAQRPTLNDETKGKATFDLEERLLQFSGRIIRLVDALPNTRAANHVAGQLLRSGTSPLGNHGEAEAAESRKDFIHKLGVCLKELKETRRWLRLLQLTGLASKARMAAILNETEELIRVFSASIRTAEKNAK